MTEWTPQQERIFDFLDSTSASCMINARAGTGKTTTLVESLNHLQGSTIALAFNRKIKLDFEARVGDSAVCKTMNGLGHRAMCNFFGRRVKIDRDKNFKIAKQLIGDDKSLTYTWSPLMQLVSRAKHMGLVPDSIPGTYNSLYPDTEEAWQELADHHDIEFDETILRMARRALKLSINQSWQGTCDFDDQIYIPVCWDAPFDLFDNVIVDEAQDLSNLQHRVVEKTLRPGGRIVAAGDVNQAIYGWRAAASDSIPRLIEKFALEELDLTVSWRCARKIITQAQQDVPSIEARLDAPDGFVGALPEWGPHSFKYGDVVLCRNNGPLITLAYRLISAGVPTFVMGRDIGRGLKNLVKKLSKQYSISDIDSLLSALESWREGELGMLKAKSRYSQMIAVQDKCDSLEAIAINSGATSIEEVLLRIDELFSRESGKVCLSTVHRAKGMEWERVFFLNSDLIPSYWTMKAIEKAGENGDAHRFDWMFQEECNIRYVAVTRAKNELMYVNLEDYYG